MVLRPRGQLWSSPVSRFDIEPWLYFRAGCPKVFGQAGLRGGGRGSRGKLRSNISFNPGYPGLLVSDIADQDTYAYRGFYMDACRAMDFLLGRPEVDVSRIGVHGGSQGGALSLVLAALHAGSVACCAVGAPFLCGIWDATRLTRSYPYEEINEFVRAHPDLGPQVETTVAYYDVLNFARMITCPTLVHIGLADDICPPETGLALHESLTCPKELLMMEGGAHDAGAYFFGENVRRFLAEHLNPVGVG